MSTLECTIHRVSDINEHIPWPAKASNATRRRASRASSELLDWIKLLLAEDIPLEALRGENTRSAIPPLYGALLKNEQDVHLFEQLVFLDRRTNPQ